MSAVILGMPALVYNATVAAHGQVQIKTVYGGVACLLAVIFIVGGFLTIQGSQFGRTVLSFASIGTILFFLAMWIQTWGTLHDPSLVDKAVVYARAHARYDGMSDETVRERAFAGANVMWGIGFLTSLVPIAYCVMLIRAMRSN
jgi:hypothetical protein